MKFTKFEQKILDILQLREGKSINEIMKEFNMSNSKNSADKIKKALYNLKIKEYATEYIYSSSKGTKKWLAL